MSAKLSRRQLLKAGLTAMGPLVLAACAPQATPAPAPQAPAAPATTAPAVPTAAPATKGIPKIYIWSNFITLIRPDGSDPERLEEVRKYLIDKVGVECYAYPPPPGAAAQEKLNLMLASKSEELDIFVGNWDQYLDAIIPLNDLLNRYGQTVYKLQKDFHGVNHMVLATDSKGTIWGIPRAAALRHAHPFWVRTDWLKELGLPMPNTLEEVEKTFEAFRRKYPDCIFLSSSLNDLRQATTGGWTEYGYSRWLDSADGTIKPAELQPDFPDWVAKMAEWYKKGWMFKEQFASFDVPQIAKTGRVAMFAGWYSRVTILIEQIKEAVPGMDFDFNPKGIIGPKGVLNTFNTPGTSAYLITKKAKHPDAVIKFVNWQYEDVENAVTTYYGIPGKDWVWDDEENAKYGKKYYLKRLITPETPGAKLYAGEFMTSSGNIMEGQFGPSDKQWRRHYEYLRDIMLDFSAGKKPFDFEVPYDLGAIRKKFPGLNDINRLFDEETVKFITGARPLNEWKGFQEQLNKAGLQDWIAAFTEQYKQYKK